MENEFNQLQKKYEAINQEKEILIQDLVQKLSQARSEIIELRKRPKELETELKAEEIANNLMLEKERNQRQLLEHELAKKQTEITNYENWKQTGEKIIQQLKKEINELRVEKIQNANLRQELLEKDKKIQELIEQVKTMEKVMEQELTSQVEILPKGWI